MSRTSAPLHRLALLLSFPVVLLAAMGAWVLISERERVVAGLHHEAENRLNLLVADLKGAPVDAAIREASAVMPPWRFRGMEPPPPGKLYADYLTARSLIRDGNPADAATLLAGLLANPTAGVEYSPAGLPVVPLLWRAMLDADPAHADRHALSLYRAALKYPSELTKLLAEDAKPWLPDETKRLFKPDVENSGFLMSSVRNLNAARRAGLASLQTVAVVRPGDATDTSSNAWLNTTTISGGWLDFWYANWAESEPEVIFTNQTQVGEVLLPLLERFRSMEPRLLLGWKIAWCGKDVIYSPGSEFVARESWPWRAVVTLTSPEILSVRVADRTRFLGWVLATALLVVAFAMWMTFRAFKKQAALARLQSEFVASVSHELRTPVASIGVLAERLGEGNADAEQTAEYHRFIAREGRRLASLVDNVLDFSRIERGAKAYELEHTDLPRLVRETAALMRPHAEEKGLTLTEEIHDVPEHLWPPVDAVAIRQALVNLIDNAIKFTPAGGTVTVKFSALDRHVMIHIRDTGIGIPPNEHSRIFQRFHRLDNGLRRETTGAGIGLSIVKHIAEAHGARVTVASENGNGAVFTLHFPPAAPAPAIS